MYSPSGSTALLFDSVRIKGRMKLFQAAKPAKMLTTPRTGRAMGHTRRANTVRSLAPSIAMAS